MSWRILEPADICPNCRNGRSKCRETTKVRRGNKYIGENTDGEGFLMSLEGIVDPKGKRIVLFGAGGAARAIGVELALAGASSISVVNRTAERGMELVRVLNNHTPARAEVVSWQSKYKVQPDADISINATSIGLYPHVHDRLDIDIESLKPGMVVADVIPNPPRTHFIKDAEARGCTIVDGLGSRPRLATSRSKSRRSCGVALPRK